MPDLSALSSMLSSPNSNLSAAFGDPTASDYSSVAQPAATSPYAALQAAINAPTSADVASKNLQTISDSFKDGSLTPLSAILKGITSGAAQNAGTKAQQARDAQQAQLTQSLQKLSDWQAQHQQAMGEVQDLALSHQKTMLQQDQYGSALVAAQNGDGSNLVSLIKADDPTNRTMMRQFGMPDGAQFTDIHVQNGVDGQPQLIATGMDAKGNQVVGSTPIPFQKVLGQIAPHVQQAQMAQKAAQLQVANTLQEGADKHAQSEATVRKTNADADVSEANAKITAGGDQGTQNAVDIYADKIRNGLVSKPSGFEMKNNPIARAAWNQVVTQPDNNYDQNNFGVRGGMERYVASGKGGQKIESMETAINHAGLLSDALDGLNNGNVQAINKAANYFGVQVGDTPAQTVKSIGAIVGPEIESAYAANGGSEAGRQKIQEALAGDQMSPQQAHAVLSSAIELFKGKGQAVSDNAERVLGSPVPVFNQNTQGVMNRIQAKAQNSLTGLSALPQGFKALPNGMVEGPHGEQYKVQQR